MPRKAVLPPRGWRTHPFRRSQSGSLTHLPAWRTGPHAHTRCTRLARGADTRHAVTGRSTGSGLLDAQVTQLTGQLTRWEWLRKVGGASVHECDQGRRADARRRLSGTKTCAQGRVVLTLSLSLSLSLCLCVPLSLRVLLLFEEWLPPPTTTATTTATTTTAAAATAAAATTTAATTATAAAARLASPRSATVLLATTAATATSSSAYRARAHV